MPRSLNIAIATALLSMNHIWPNRSIFLAVVWGIVALLWFVTWAVGA